MQHPQLEHYCGYIGLSEGHPAYGMSVDELKLRCRRQPHRGITWAQHRPGGGRQDTPPEEHTFWWFGFSCSHEGVDLIPGLLNEKTPKAILESGATVKSRSYVRRQCLSFSKNLAKMEVQEHEPAC